MNRSLAVRLLVLLLAVAALRAAGLVTFDLPWRDPAFLASGATVLVYLVWSLAGARPEPGAGPGLSRIALYTVLAVSAFDGFIFLPGSNLPVHTLLRDIHPARFAGVAMLAAGSALDLLSKRNRRMALPAVMLQMDGFALGLGSVAGMLAGCLGVAMVIYGHRTDGDAGDEGAGTEG
ncbi:hypothetical protein GX411_09010 [Candidatus Fermentibacteria bacterium]|nr:hypothetical protein [Candidatus Fermentibacteria bacterium]